MLINKNTIVTPSGNAAVSELDGGLALIDLDNGNYFHLNKTATIVWNAIQKNTSVEDIADLILAEYDANKDTVLTDVTAMVEDFIKQGFAKAA